MRNIVRGRSLNPFFGARFDELSAGQLQNIVQNCRPNPQDLAETKLLGIPDMFSPILGMLRAEDHAVGDGFSVDPFLARGAAAEARDA